ncbi:MAG: hypothetical protein U0326_14290 [Polyangiales bacterium]
MTLEEQREQGFLRERERLIAVEMFVAAGLCAWAWKVAIPDRAEVLPSVFAEIAVLALCVITLTTRDPLGTLRLSNPALSMVGWMFYYFIKPAFTWLQGYRMMFESSSTIILDASIVSDVQLLHCYFMGAFFTTYLLVAPRRMVRPIFTRDSQPNLPVLPFILLGLAPYVGTMVDRIATTGTIFPTASYGEAVAAEADSLFESRAEGGAGYFLTQVLSKVWYFPLMALGLGYGVLVSKYVTQKRWLRVAAIFAQVPVLLLLGSGSRSGTIYPFLLAIMIADALSGPYRWWRLTPLMGVALEAFDFYGFFRGHQQEGFQAGIESSLREIDAAPDTARSEDATMLTKEAYCLFIVNHGRDYKGIEYFAEQLIQLLPAQLAPEKMRQVNTADFLANELIGYGRYASGVAGAMVGDGYLMGGTLGVICLSAVLGLTFGLVVRWGMSGANGQAVLWRYLLMVMISVQATQYIRADFSVVLVQILYYVVLPGLAMRVLSDARIITSAGWARRLSTMGRAGS